MMLIETINTIQFIFRYAFYYPKAEENYLYIFFKSPHFQIFIIAFPFWIRVDTAQTTNFLLKMHIMKALYKNLR